MRVYYFRCYRSSNLLFFVRCVTYISNLRKIGQKLRSLSRAIRVSDGQTDRQTNTQVIIYLCNAMNCIGHTIIWWWHDQSHSPAWQNTTNIDTISSISSGQHPVAIVTCDTQHYEPSEYKTVSWFTPNRRGANPTNETLSKLSSKWQKCDISTIVTHTPRS